jgi:hypothetical protein
VNREAELKPLSRVACSDLVVRHHVLQVAHSSVFYGVLPPLNGKSSKKPKTKASQESGLRQKMKGATGAKCHIPKGQGKTQRPNPATKLYVLGWSILSKSFIVLCDA